MLYPSVHSLLKSSKNRYSLVVLTAKLAREIANESEKSGEILKEKPVKLAINKIYSNILQQEKNG
ncbi:DNA-directed RNA polymerase subunit omega [bioreactor metagenome]|uniref:DNA-directed RNA polymerase n=1 Tax=bioreactor metagenome TaxID=1076179 RepID=A0A645BX71_9ZZZZ